MSENVENQVNFSSPNDINTININNGADVLTHVPDVFNRDTEISINTSNENKNDDHKTKQDTASVAQDVITNVNIADTNIVSQENGHESVELARNLEDKPTICENYDKDANQTDTIDDVQTEHTPDESDDAGRIEEEDDEGEFIGVGSVESSVECDADTGEAIISDPHTNFPLTNSHRKNRRRILIYNDGQSSENSENEDEREAILRSQSPIETPLQPNSNESVTEISLPIIPDKLDDIVIANERPGPKSMKQSTRILKEMQTRALLQSAVVIPAQAKKKKRIIDSDDDEIDNGVNVMQVETNVDDIGAIADDNDNIDNDEDQPSDILIDVSVILRENFDMSESDENNDNDDHEKEDDVENSITEEEENEDDDEDDEVEDEDADKDENKNEEKDQKPILRKIIKREPSADVICKPEPESLLSEQIQPGSVVFVKSEPFDAIESIYNSQVYCPLNINLVTIKCEPDLRAIKSELNAEAQAKIEKSINRDSGNSTDSTNKKLSGQHNPKNIFDVSLNEPIFNSSSSEETYLPNDEYFGTATTTDTRRHYGRWSKHKIIKHGKPGETSSSSSSDEYNYLYNVTTSSATAHKKKKKKKKNRHMPNDVYFGDVKVPLHVLHSYDNESSSDSDKYTFATPIPSVQHKALPPKLNSQKHGKKRTAAKQSNQSSSSIKQNHNPGGNSLLKSMKKFLAVAGIKPKFNELWKGCKTFKQRSDRILHLLHQKGLEGEPTIVKCRKLRKSIRVQREAEGLDPTVIIPIEGEGRTRRSATKTTRTETKQITIYENVEEVKETLRKIKDVIDSDSDYDGNGKS